MQLTESIKRAGASPILLESWAFRDGDGHNRAGDTFLEMQKRLSQGCIETASAAGAKLVPIGRAFQRAVEKHPQIQLWQHDGRHASRAGIYLAAAVIYAFIFGAHPQELPLIAPNARQGGLRPRDVDVLQHVVAELLSLGPHTMQQRQGREEGPRPRLELR
jgi:hypothetical protein